MTITTGTFISEILIAFYLYLLVRPQHVKRPPIYLVGLCVLVVAIASQYFLLARRPGNAGPCLEITASLVAFVAAVLACYAGPLPFSLPAGLNQVQTLPDESDSQAISE